MGFFNRKTDKSADAQAQSIYDYFAKSKDVLSAFAVDEKSAEERMKEVFTRPLFAEKMEIVRTAQDGSRSATKDGIFAFDAADGSDDNKIQNDNAMALKRKVLGDVINEDVWKHFENETYIGWTACAMLAQNPVIHLACQIPAEDAIACGYKLSFADHNDADKDKDGKPDDDYLTALKKKTAMMKIDDVCVKLDYNKRVFGQGIAMPVLYTKDGKPYDMSNPFNPDGLKNCVYKGWKVIDPYWLTPQFEENATRDPMHLRFMQPSWYKMPDGRQVHYTWFVKVDNAEVADILRPTYYYGGMPLTQMIYKRVWCAEKTANEAPQLAMSKRLLIVDANVQQIIKNKNYVYKLMQVITKCRTNWGVFFKSPTANIQQIDTSLTEFEECMFSQYQLVASIAQMPATKLLQTTPKGFNSTGEFEWKIYAQLEETIQNREYVPLIEKHLRILTAVQGDKRIINVTFNEVDAPNEKERVEIDAQKSNTRCNYVQNGILTPEEVRSAMRNEEGGEYSSIEVESPDLKRQAEIEEVMRKIEEEKNDNTDKE